MTEWDFLTETRTQLQPYGDVALRYVTAQFQPYSSKDRPDLVFIAPQMPHVAVFVEFKLLLAASSNYNIVQTLKEHSEFAQSDSDITLKFMFATSASIPENIKDQLSAVGIWTADNIAAPMDLVQKIRTISADHE